MNEEVIKWKGSKKRGGASMRTILLIRHAPADYRNGTSCCLGSRTDVPASPESSQRPPLCSLSFRSSSRQPEVCCPQYGRRRHRRTGGIFLWYTAPKRSGFPCASFSPPVIPSFWIKFNVSNNSEIILNHFPDLFRAESSHQIADSFPVRLAVFVFIILSPILISA